MIYQVKAKFNYEKAQEFHQKLIDGTIEKTTIGWIGNSKFYE